MRINTIFPRVRVILLLFMVSIVAMGNGFGLEGNNEKISIEIASDPVYPSGDSVDIGITIKNAGDSDVAAAVGGLYGLKVVVVGPDKKQVVPYPYYPLVGGKLVASTIKQGESAFQSLDLSNYFRFGEAGDYRVTLTKRVYGEGDAVDPYMSDLKGDPMDVESKSFEFRVEVPSKMKIRSMQHLGTGATPDDQLDGIGDVEWYQKNTASPSKNRDEPKKDSSNVTEAAPSAVVPLRVSESVSHGNNVTLWIAIALVAVLVLAGWLIYRKRKAA